MIQKERPRPLGMIDPSALASYQPQPGQMDMSPQMFPDALPMGQPINQS
eukprot:gene24405-10422_t